MSSFLNDINFANYGNFGLLSKDEEEEEEMFIMYVSNASLNLEKQIIIPFNIYFKLK